MGNRASKSLKATSAALNSLLAKTSVAPRPLRNNRPERLLASFLGEDARRELRASGAPGSRRRGTRTGAGCGPPAECRHPRRSQQQEQQRAPGRERGHAEAGSAPAAVLRSATRNSRSMMGSKAMQQWDQTPITTENQTINLGPPTRPLRDPA